MQSGLETLPALSAQRIVGQVTSWHSCIIQTVRTVDILYWRCMRSKLFHCLFSGIEFGEFYRHCKYCTFHVSACRSFRNAPADWGIILTRCGCFRACVWQLSGTSSCYVTAADSIGWLHYTFYRCDWWMWCSDLASGEITFSCCSSGSLYMSVSRLLAAVRRT